MNNRKSFIPGVVAFTLLFALQVFSQGAQKEISTQREKVRKCDTLFYYGLDVSHVRVTDKSKVSRSLSYGLAYPPAWIGYVEEELPPYKYVQHKLEKKVFYYVEKEVQHNTLHVSTSFIIEIEYSFPIDTVNKAVKSYSLTQQSGVGLVIIAENFNKKHDKSFCWVTFFDIKTREVLWAVRVSGNCRHMGYTAHWGSGIVTGFKKFISSYY